MKKDAKGEKKKMSEKKTSESKNVNKWRKKSGK